MAIALNRVVIAGRFCILLIVMIGVACQPVSPPPTITATSAAPGWSGVQILTHTREPIFQPALTFNNGQPIAGWWSHSNNTIPAQLSLSNLIATGTPIAPSTVTAQTPDQLSLFPSTYGLLAIWRDQNKASVDSADRRLYVALFNRNLTLARPSVPITTQATDSYAAIRLPSGDVAIAASEHTGDALDSLMISTLDAGGTGSSGTALTIAANVAHPALTLDANGRLIAAWLSPQPGSTWAVQAAAIQISVSSAHKITLQRGSIATLGFLQPGGSDDSHLIDSLIFTSNGESCTAIWSTVAIKPGAISDLSGFTFPCASISDPNDRSALFPAQNHVIDNARWPVGISTMQKTGATTPIGMTITESAGDVPAVGWLQNGRLQKVDRLMASDPHTTIGSLALAANPDNGQLSALWSQINLDGTIMLNFVQFNI